MADPYENYMDGLPEGPYCLQCVGEHLQARAADKAGTANLPVIRQAVTWAPSWQSTMVGGQMMMSCVALPSCMQHLTQAEQSPIERATRSGLLLGGQSPQ